MVREMNTATSATRAPGMDLLVQIFTPLRTRRRDMAAESEPKSEFASLASLATPVVVCPISRVCCLPEVPSQASQASQIGVARRRNANRLPRRLGRSRVAVALNGAAVLLYRLYEAVSQCALSWNSSGIIYCRSAIRTLVRKARRHARPDANCLRGALMSRGVSSKLTAELPAQYSADWLEHMDKRTKVWRAISDRITSLESDAGGAEALSHAKRSVIRRAVFLELLCESEEVRFAGGESLDVGRFTQALNSMLGAYRLIGVERKARTVRRLSDIMNGTDAGSPA